MFLDGHHLPDEELHAKELGGELHLGAIGGVRTGTRGIRVVVAFGGGGGGGGVALLDIHLADADVGLLPGFALGEHGVAVVEVHLDVLAEGHAPRVAVEFYLRLHRGEVHLVELAHPAEHAVHLGGPVLHLLVGELQVRHLGQLAEVGKRRDLEGVGVGGEGGVLRERSREALLEDVRGASADASEAASEEAVDVTLERRREGGSMRPRSARREARGAAIARVDATVDASIADIVDRRGSGRDARGESARGDRVRG